jgi:hypothetical protein
MYHVQPSKSGKSFLVVDEDNKSARTENGSPVSFRLEDLAQAACDRLNAHTRPSVTAQGGTAS